MPFEKWISLLQLLILLISGAAIPIVIFIVGNRYTKAREIEEKLRGDRVDIYFKIIEPFLLLFSTEKLIQASMKTKKDKSKSGSDLAAEKLLTLEYQDYSFKLGLIGSDNVVRAFNNLMQAFYNPQETDEDESGFILINYMAVLLIEIRKSVGNEKTKLHPIEMLEWKISDLRNYQEKGIYSNMDSYY